RGSRGSRASATRGPSSSFHSRTRSPRPRAGWLSSKGHPALPYWLRVIFVRKPVPTLGSSPKAGFSGSRARDVDRPVDVRPDAATADPVDMERDRGPPPGIAEPMDLVKPGAAEGTIACMPVDRAQGRCSQGCTIEGVFGFGERVVADRIGAPG